MRELTFVIIKPDAIKRGLIGAIIRRFEQKDLQIIKMEIRIKNEEWCKQHYANILQLDHYPMIEDAMTRTCLIGMILEGYSAIQVVKTMVGATDSRVALPGTIRGDFGTYPIHCNLVHAADWHDSARREIALFFNDSTNQEITEPSLPFTKKGYYE